MRRPTTAVLLATLFFAPPAVPDVVARQGTTVEPEQERQRFESPMIVDLPWGPIGDLPEGGHQPFPEFLRYWCEDTRLIAVQAARGRRSRGAVRIEISGMIQVEDSFDRIARIEVSAVAGERVLARAEHARIDAEEEKVTPFRVRLDLPLSAIAELGAAGDGAKLVVRLALRDNS